MGKVELAKVFAHLLSDDSFFNFAIEHLSKNPEISGIVELVKKMKTRGYVADFEIAEALECSVEEIHEITESNPEIKKNSLELPVNKAGNS